MAFLTFSLLLASLKVCTNQFCLFFFFCSISCTDFSNISFPPFDHHKLSLFALLAADPPSLAASPHGTRSPPYVPLSCPCPSPAPRPGSLLLPAPALPLCSPFGPGLLTRPRRAGGRGRAGSTGQKRKSHPGCPLPEVLPSPQSQLIKIRGGCPEGAWEGQEVSPRRCREVSRNANSPCAGVKLSKPKFR